jgi:hypothetical protein
MADEERAERETTREMLCAIKIDPFKKRFNVSLIFNVVLIFVLIFVIAGLLMS